MMIGYRLDSTEMTRGHLDSLGGWSVGAQPDLSAMTADS